MGKIFESDAIIPIDGGHVIVNKEGDITLEGNNIVIERNRGAGNPYFRIFRKGQLKTILQFPDKNKLSYYWIYQVIASIGIRIEGVPLIELPDEQNFFLLAQEKHKDSKNNSAEFASWSHGFAAGYKASEKKYTEADMKKAIELARKVEFTNVAGQPTYSHFESDILKSLQTKVPISVELEYECGVCKSNLDKPYSHKMGCEAKDGSITKLKITNPETNTITPVNISYEAEVS